MTKILIADDEKLIRAGIRKILTENLPQGIEILEAKNGQEAFEICQSEHPYVVITDIRMPIMDGIGLMEKIKTMDEKPAVIVLSGFDDFTYAKAAIQNGAVNYILKPVDSKELVDNVNAALKNIKKQEHSQKQKSLQNIMSLGFANKDELNAKDFPNGLYCVTFEKLKLNDLDYYFEDVSPCYILNQRKNSITVLVTPDGIKYFQDSSKFEDTIVGISEMGHSISDLRRLTYQSQSAVLQSFFMNKGNTKTPGFYYYTERSTFQDFTEVDTRYEKVIAAIDLLADETIRKHTDKFLDFTFADQDQRGDLLHYVEEKLTKSLFRRYPKLNENDSYLYVKSLMIENIDLCESLAEWKHCVNDYIIYMNELLHQQQGKFPYITKAVSYISQHYAEDITMASVANYVSMNYTWFSEKFKEQMGINFNDYLKKFRMEQAKQLLKLGTYKVYEVAVKTGFKDVKHFMKCFKEMNGTSAGEWARTHAN